jgi:hypothetical protein
MALDQAMEAQVISFQEIGYGFAALFTAVILWLFVWLLPVFQKVTTLEQLIVATLFRRAQRAMYIAHAADTALVAYHEAKAADKTCPRSAWLEVCQR